MQKADLIKLAGGLWAVIGTFLIYRSVLLYQLAATEQGATELSIALSVLAGLAIGAAKGKFVLSKTARKNKTRIENLAVPLKIHHLFAKPFYGFIVGMMLLGVALRTFNEYLGGYLVVGAVYCGIGMALIVSSLVYWKNGSEKTATEEVS
ncbi:MAG: hypothetical protein ACE5G9_12900 [Nitrospinales bacterium]